MKALSKVEAAPREARRSPRQRTLLRGRISYSNGAISLDCLVTQISAGGAKIDIPEDVTLPELFQIEIPQRQIVSPARIVRREADCAAIRFDVEETAQASLAALRERVRVLEAENKMLRANCATLSAQLERDKAAY